MHHSDYPLSEVPPSARKGLLSTSAVLLGFTFFTATMWAGGTLGQAFPIGQLLWIILAGNLLLGAYALGAGAAYFSPLLPPLVGVAVGAASYAVLLRLKHATLSDSHPSTAKP